MMVTLKAAADFTGAWTASGIVLGAAVGMALGWLRRSRRNEASPERVTALPVMPRQPSSLVEPEEAASPRQFQLDARPSLRIRGLLLLNLGPSDGAEHIEHAPPLGDRGTVIASIQEIAAGMSFDAAGRGTLAGAHHSLSLDLGPEDPVHAAVASAEGDAGLDLLRRLMERQRWRAYAPRAGVFIDADALDLFALPGSITHPSARSKDL